MNFPLSLEKKINKFGQKAKIFEKNENAHEIRKKNNRFMSGRDIILWFHLIAFTGKRVMLDFVLFFIRIFTYHART